MLKDDPHVVDSGGNLPQIDPGAVGGADTAMSALAHEVGVVDQAHYEIKEAGVVFWHAGQQKLRGVTEETWKGA